MLPLGEIISPLQSAQDLFVTGSVADTAAVEAAVTSAVAKFGRLDILVNNAAKLSGGGSLTATSGAARG
eukprot:SAG31_NODE_585_length_13845_cov_25.623163_5_plen_69_part_00